MLASYHNHSCWSDGTATIRQMALAAREAGIGEFGISDHLVLHPQAFSEARFWSMAPNMLRGYFQEAQQVQAELSQGDFQVRIGLEADYFPETVEPLKRLLQEFPFDYVIGAVHYAGGIGVDRSIVDWQRLDASQIHAIWKEYLQKIQGAITAGCFDFIAHLDLPKKFGFAMPQELQPQLDELLTLLAEANMPMEINTAGVEKLCRQCYPAPPIIRRAAELKVPLLVNADAHGIREVQRYFDDARAFLHAIGVDNVCAFQQRQRRMIPLDFTPR